MWAKKFHFKSYNSKCFCQKVTGLSSYSHTHLFTSHITPHSCSPGRSAVCSWYWPPHPNPLPTDEEIEAGSVCFGSFCFFQRGRYFRTHLTTFKPRARLGRLWDSSCLLQHIFTLILQPTLCRAQLTQHQRPSHISAAQQQLSPLTNTLCCPVIQTQFLNHFP